MRPVGPNTTFPIKTVIFKKMIVSFTCHDVDFLSCTCRCHLFHEVLQGISVISSQRCRLSSYVPQKWPSGIDPVTVFMFIKMRFCVSSTSGRWFEKSKSLSSTRAVIDFAVAHVWCAFWVASAVR